MDPPTDRSPGGHRRAGVALAVVAIAILSTYIVLVWCFTADDAYITLRYSRNLARGLGAVYNPNGPHAEGFTSLLWMLLLALPHLAGVDALLAAKGAGVAMTFATCALVAAWAFLDCGPRSTRGVAAGAAALAYAALPRTAVHAVSGMETALFTVVQSATVFAACRLARGDLRWTWPLTVLGLAATITRPEAGLVVVVSAAAALTTLPRPARRRPLTVLALGWGLPVVGLELLRLRYFGLPLPLPFYVKVTTPTVDGPLSGARPVAEWAATLPRFVLPVVVFLRGRPSFFRPAMATVLALATFFLLPQHLMGYESRYLAPLDPIVCVAFGIGVAMLLDQTQAPAARQALRRRAALAVASIVVAVAFGFPDSRRVVPQALKYAGGLSACHVRLGQELAAANLGSARIALSDAGAVPYLSDLWALDLVGLNEPRIAVTHSRDPDWILSHSLDVLILVSIEPDRFVITDWNQFEIPLLEAATSRGFRRVARRQFKSDYWLWIFVRPDGAASRLSLADSYVPL